ncbi:RluA family pseudouridine synthase [Calothrix sp. UHCC 0171]|uniref:RluA family pseudouridine synthase n=1 Tax=Calothrix sp. UHCC 0171 TaxID=3110245 RepID=UPI002B1F4F95|nr:RluA family pseudouridine synthase [Calothrix sp. UHCC 0171]MEA5570666.1 RluA family pseudouridine synthase [Calothrix sp. UHCC 0171]
MGLLHPLSDFLDHNYPIDKHYLNTASANYFYQGNCPQTGTLLKLPRTPLVENIARGLMQYLASDEQYSREGKMYGILLVELPNGEQGILKAFSGLLNGCSQVAGWVPPIPGRDAVALDESRTLAELDNIKQEIITLQQIPERQQYQTIARELAVRSQNLQQVHQQRKQQRHQQRQIFTATLTGETLALALAELDAASRQDGIELKLWKREVNQKTHSIRQIIEVADKRIVELKQLRKQLSQQLQAQMHTTYSLTNFLGISQTLRQLMPLGLPTGTGDCCAPKLLHYAAINILKPLAMAEFWWGEPSRIGDKIPGEFYGACGERCQPIMGFLLSGIGGNQAREKEKVEKLDLVDNKTQKSCENISPSLITNPHSPLPIIYQDEYLIAIDKPAGLLSVPGRYHHTQDSVLSRLRNLLPDGMNLMAIHRLDQETSGILLFARHLDIYRQISQQFLQRQVEKIYEAVLSGYLETQNGVIRLPLWGNPENRPYQEVNFTNGKASVTHYKILERQSKYTRVEFQPITGRTHQIRVHASDKMGLNMPILGDKLYGCQADVNRLHLHARELTFRHPNFSKICKLVVKTPF